MPAHTPIRSVCTYPSLSPASSKPQPTAPPGLLGLSCMRFDTTIYLPQNLRTLHVQAHALSQIKFDEDSNFDLDKLSVNMYKLDQRSILLPTEGMHARSMKMQIARGWLVGAVTAGDEVSLMTQTGDATLNVHVHVHSAPSSAAPVRLLTSTGAGRTDVVWASHAAGLPHRPIDATHHMSMGGAAYLTYKDAGYSGTVDLTVKSFTATGLQAMFEKEGLLPYVGSRAGVDRMLVKAQGWVGLYF